MFIGFFRYPRLHNLHVVIEETKGMLEVHQFIFKFTYEKQRGLEHVKGRIREERKKSNLSCQQLLRYTEGK